MKSLYSIICLLIVWHANAQYYYKDILIPQQAAEQLRNYKVHKVRTVRLSSFESDGQPTENFEGSQQVDPGFTGITTHLSSALSGSSQLVSIFNTAGDLIKTTDTTDGSGSTTEYYYTANRELAKLINVSVSPGSHRETEQHLWTFTNGRPVGMLRIKDNTDTTYVRFVIDDKGNVAEENSTRGGSALPSYYYYYDERTRLTDIASYNIKAKRLLPDYVFEYTDNGSLGSMMVVPEGSSDYQKWYYEYANSSGLKTRETAFNKKKEMLGKIEYKYN